MPRLCSTCQHTRHEDIDRAIAAGTSHRQLAAEFGLARASVDRHAASHVPARLVEAQANLRTLSAHDLLASVSALNAEAEAVMAAAKRNGDYQLVLNAIDRSRGVLGLLGRVLAEARALTEQEQNGGHDSRTCPYRLPHKSTCPDAIARDRLVQTMVAAMDLTHSIPAPEPDAVFDNRLELELRGLDPDGYTVDELSEDERTAISQIDTEVTHSPVYQSNPPIPTGGRSWSGGEWRA